MRLAPSADGGLASANVALVDPSGMSTLAGTPTSAGSPLDRMTSAPPTGAAAESDTVPTAGLPATTLAGDSVTDDSAAAAGGGGGVPRAVTLSVAGRGLAFEGPDNVALPAAAGSEAGTVKPGGLAPRALVTDARAV